LVKIGTAYQECVFVSEVVLSMDGMCRQLDGILLSKFIISAVMECGFDHAQPPKRNLAEKTRVYKWEIELKNMF
jgi:hypothetical protein